MIIHPFYSRSTGLFILTACMAGALFATALSTRAARPSGEFLLWTGSAPGAIGNEIEDMPTLTPYYASSTKATGAAMIVCPGGGYSFLSSLYEGSYFAEWLNQLGISAFVLKYRLGPDGYHMPVQLDDAQRAIRYVRAYAEEWELDPGRVGIIGASAGGHLAAMTMVHFEDGDPGSLDPVETVSSRPDLGVLCYPVITMDDAYTHEGSKTNLLGPYVDVQEAVDYCSCELQVKTNTPRAFLMHTVSDPKVPYQNSTMFADALASNGVPYELHLYPTGGHGIGLGSTPSDPAHYHDWVGECAYWLFQQDFGMPHLGKIWPLGDSITYGAAVPTVAGGYRHPLYTNLVARGYDFRFVGSTAGNSTALLNSKVQNRHDGHSGYTIMDISGYSGTGSGIYDEISTWMPTNTPPDLILLMIGINDINHDYDIDTAPDRLDLLMTRLFTLYPECRVLIASLPDADQDNPYRGQNKPAPIVPATNDLAVSISDYNMAMAEMVADRQAQGQSIALVDMHAGLTMADLSDGLHPNAGGYRKIAEIWADAIESPPTFTTNAIETVDGMVSVSAKGTVGTGFSFWASADLMVTNGWTLVTNEHLRMNPVILTVPATNTQAFYRFGTP